MNFFRVLVVVTASLVPSLFAGAQIASPDPSDSTQHKPGEPAQLVFWNRQITVFRSNFNQLSPAERAVSAAQRIAALPEVTGQIAVNQVSTGQYSGAVVSVDGHFAFAILTTDLDWEAGETLSAAGDQAAANLRAALEARALQQKWPVILRGIAFFVAATILLILAFWLVLRISHKALTRIDEAASVRTQKLKLGGFDLRPLLYALIRGAVKLAIWCAVVTLVYLWLVFVLLLFPYSEPWGRQLGAFLINLLAMLGTGALRAAPGLFTVAVIFLLTRVVARVIDGIFQGVERGDLDVPWLDPDVAKVTRRLVTMLFWIFALTVAYPFIPGSNTDAFKGVSVLLGLMVSLGSAGLINQVMSGLVVIYSRALRVGEFVHIGDDLGTVTEVGMLSTKILTWKNEEVTIPNAVLVGTRTVNYSRHEADMVGTTVTIGYDAPWRQVHAMLLQAAEQTAGIRKVPAPSVYEKSLSDFYVEYELIVNLDVPEERVQVLSELHMHIQDAFNEQGVQIMSPHFMTQPKETVFVPRSQWFAGQKQTTTKQNDSESE